MLLALLACAGAAALARQGDAPAPVRRIAVTAPAQTHEGDRLRDGQALDLNRASATELELLPGVGPRLAREIVEERARRGGFRSLEALDDVRGIGAKKLAKLRPLLKLEQLEHAAEAQRDVGGAQ
ncbi:MAG: helix-hairpin-helix domain-containing protein [Polyangiales bacterium]